MCCSQESMIHRIHQDSNCSYSSIHPIASRTELVPIGDLNTYISNSNEQLVNVKLRIREAIRFWILYRAKQDGHVVMGWRHPWDGHGDHGHGDHH
ncbi:hypothetical protein IGI04_018503 [Brassica rapa subsp. trilocularis]|uniref:Uncharacterized protein n=1 Tax=Brassica rapa subsp. trilocularis TaxID=1813537 RepID=A0ABQ7MGM1_BRACM|nr:hypothetical protein IGI04_018503 [Brassica rapa subsp. trilocularis]